MPDPADVSDAEIARHLDHSLKQAVGKSGAEYHPDFDGEHCVECEVDMHAVRLQWGRVRCIHCQERLEKRAKLGVA